MAFCFCYLCLQQQEKKFKLRYSQIASIKTGFSNKPHCIYNIPVVQNQDDPPVKVILSMIEKSGSAAKKNLAQKKCACHRAPYIINNCNNTLSLNIHELMSVFFD